MPKTDATEFLRSRRAWRPPELNSRLEFGGGELIVWPDNGFRVKPGFQTNRLQQPDEP
jgi:hypothetical protein